jgi:Sulfotransferase domain
MLSRLFQRRFDIDERKLLEFPMLRKAVPEVPRLLFTHAGDAMRPPDDIHLDAKEYSHCRVVLLARHPGDVAVSRYHHLKHRSRDPARRRLAEQPLESFVWSDQGGIPSIVRFMNLWAELARSRKDVGIVRYEDFLSDPHGTLRQLAKQVGLKVTKADIDDAVAFASFDKLKEREREGYFVSSRLRPAKRNDEGSFKVRSGSSGGYRKRLSPVDAEKVDAYVAEHLDPLFGYGAA